MFTRSGQIDELLFGSAFKSLVQRASYATTDQQPVSIVNKTFYFCYKIFNILTSKCQ